MTHSRRATGEVTSQLVIAPAWVTADGAAAYTSLRPEFIKAAFRRGELPGYRHGHRTLRFKLADLDAWMSAAEVAASRARDPRGLPHQPVTAQPALLTPSAWLGSCGARRPRASPPRPRLSPAVC